MTKEESILLKHFEDLSKTSFNKGFPTYSGFLTLHEQSLLSQAKLSTKYTFVGGYDYAERKMVCFYDDFMPKYHPYSVLIVEAQNSKFADILTHRDYLGALMNLGIERDVLGDMIKISEQSTYIICKESIADFIVDNCRTVKHTSVVCRIIPADELAGLEIVPSFEEITGSVSSFRLDCILALAFRKSRTQIGDLIKSGNVFVNSRLVENASYQLKQGETVSARGFGKFIFADEGGTSKKGKLYVTLKKFT
ncbi:MAG: RNA-binding protein [Lachnospiraceae bacterium]|nr:RNA-binding protein [Lachnospiraceae bacterium]